MAAVFGPRRLDQRRRDIARLVTRHVFEQGQQMVREDGSREIIAERVLNGFRQTLNLDRCQRREIIGVLGVVHAATISRNSVGDNWTKITTAPRSDLWQIRTGFATVEQI